VNEGVNVTGEVLEVLPKSWSAEDTRRRHVAYAATPASNAITLELSHRYGSMRSCACVAE
jgi:hypothetical protein